MFTLLRPQVSRHRDGWVVRIVSRHFVELEERDGTIVRSEVELGSVAVVYAGTLERRSGGGPALPVSSELCAPTAERIAAGLRAMGGPAEVA